MITSLNVRNGKAIDISTTEEKDLPMVLKQTAAHSSRSERYSLVRTSNVIDMFTKAGFQSQFICQERNRKPEFQGYGTHLLSFEHPSIVLGQFKDEIRPRLYFRNSYHGRTRLLLNLGLFRAYCENGLFFGTCFEKLTLKHIGITEEDVDQVLNIMRDAYSNRVVPFVELLKGSMMDRQTQLAFAEAVFQERMKLNKNEIVKSDFEKLLTVHRQEDEENNAWNVLNRVQENLGLNFRSSNIDIAYTYNAKDKEGNPIQKERKMSTISGIQNVTDLNQFLFDKIVELVPPAKDLKIAS